MSGPREAHEAKGEAMVAPIAGAIRMAGKDGELRVTIAISGTPEAILIAAAEWAALIGRPFEYTTKAIAPTVFGARPDADHAEPPGFIAAYGRAVFGDDDEIPF